MLCVSGRLIDVQEPLNTLNHLTVLETRVPFWYAYISESNEDRYLRAYRDAAGFRLHPFWDLKRIRLGLHRDPYRLATRWGTFLLGRVQGRRLLIKDPFAVFSLPWFSRRVGCQVVVVVRHPAAVVSSLKERGWRFDFADLLQQPYLMAERLRRYEGEMERALGNPDDVIGQGSLLWRMVYESVTEDQGLGLDIRVVRHEDLIAEPLREFQALYAYTHLPFTAKAQRIVASSAREAEWRERLTTAEMARIETLTQDVWPRYYEEGDWESD